MWLLTLVGAGYNARATAPDVATAAVAVAFTYADAATFPWVHVGLLTLQALWMVLGLVLLLVLQLRDIHCAMPSADNVDVAGAMFVSGAADGGGAGAGAAGTCEHAILTLMD